MKDCRSGELSRARYRVSADIGGTFTDIVYQDCATGACGATKVLSTPDAAARAVLRGIELAIPSGSAIDFFVHGTTVGLNALLTRRGAEVALLTTENFRDICTIQGNDRGEIVGLTGLVGSGPSEIARAIVGAGRAVRFG